jgi:hypothetical protein
LVFLNGCGRKKWSGLGFELAQATGVSGEESAGPFQSVQRLVNIARQHHNIGQFGFGLVPAAFEVEIAKYLKAHG